MTTPDTLLRLEEHSYYSYPSAHRYAHRARLMIFPRVNIMLCMNMFREGCKYLNIGNDILRICRSGHPLFLHSTMSSGPNHVVFKGS